MQTFPVLSLTIFLPLIGVLFILLVRGNDETAARNARYAALWTSIATFIVSIFLWINFDVGTADFQFVEKHQWIPAYQIYYHLGVDGISMLFVLLSTALTPLCVLASWKVIKERVREYMIAFLILETMMVGTFSSLDFLLFYVFFEGSLIPMFIIIGVWGGERRVYSAFKFFLFTLTGSVLLLVALMTIHFQAGTTDIPTLLNFDIPVEMQPWLWIAFFASFAVKMPMWPVHTWLPDAHVEAPTAGSVILAGVLLKMGGYGFLRFSLPMLPIASEQFTPLIYTLSVIAIIYTSLVALAQEDMKKLIAYSSVAHMGFVTIGIFTSTVYGIQGGIFQMLSHGVISAALFLCVGVVYDRMHTREISRYGGLIERMPKYSVVFMVFMLGAVGLPGTGGFIGEFLVLLGAFQVNTWVALLATSGIVLGAAYMLFMYRRVIFGELKRVDLKGIMDLEAREIVIFTPLIILVLWMGLWPQPFLQVMDASVLNLMHNYQNALSAVDVTGLSNR
ncbi:MAG: NADH-quinone oxidoreductase subunit M [Alphaproteobacteria bacterium]|jgi:NADH-quinone oxidoreductase subunit M|nr:NADH-quinone oxidoreductase subunit M [Alphaproteobacteria bacterium]PPR12646.1 MAG: NADH-quinone oxidoreductase subunit M [Alphaproteobacteria bacterium MarineAlpha12_Bin1]|tara:strand:- start:77685 stop:79199 length:1515 start_codon:yes stop_codon:yes gene_type:complete